MMKLNLLGAPPPIRCATLNVKTAYKVIMILDLRKAFFLTEEIILTLSLSLTHTKTITVTHSPNITFNDVSLTRG